jgi:beta-N-acetylhexosaminidase
MSYKILFISFISLFFIFASPKHSGEKKQDDNPKKSLPVYYNLKDTKWADSVLASMSDDEKIAQLFMVAAYSNKTNNLHQEELAKLIEKYKIGGLIYFQGGPVRQAKMDNYLQSKSKVPLLISIDGEWGLAMRLDSTIKYPRQMTLGALKNDDLIYEMGKEIAEQCKRIGIHVNLAPVVDINNNPRNPVISNRSFGENKYKVAEKGIAYMKGMQDNGILANAKHFPGHGDTDSDSHKTLPIVKHSKERIDSLELYPFKRMIEEGLASLMVAHLYIPSIESQNNVASTLSPAIVKGILKEELGFKGLIFTDALNMKGVSNYYAPGDVDLKALSAGNDVLLFAEDVPKAMVKIKEAILKGEISQEEIDSRAYKILLAKQWAGLDKYKPINTKNLYADLNSEKYQATNRKINFKALTVLNNENDLIPLKEIEKHKIVIADFGDKKDNLFLEESQKYTELDYVFFKSNASLEEQNANLIKLKNHDIVIINIRSTNNSGSKSYGLSPESIRIIQEIKLKYKTIVNVFANPYILGKTPVFNTCDGLIMAYEENNYTLQGTAQLIFGGIGADATLPVTVSQKYPAGSGINTEKIRLGYVDPMYLNIPSKTLQKIEEIALNGINESAYPGCQILVAKDGYVIYQKSFGFHTYEKKTPVKNTDIYDIASITKIAATLPLIMQMHSEKELTLNDKIGDFLPYLKGSNKENIIIKDMLAHQSGLRDWIPFYTNTIDKGQYKSGYYATEKSDEFPLEVAENLFINKSYKDSIRNKIIISKINQPGKYVYSDIGYYLLKDIIELKHKKSMQEVIQEEFYIPMNMNFTTYNPLEKFSKENIVPTEYDMQFRKQLIHGYVHDQGSAMMGGVGGHAGVFSNTNDLAKLMQMYLNKGEYGGKSFIAKETMEEFIACQYCKDNGNRRGAGFDKPETKPGVSSPTCDCVSYLSFGHTGFTGTMAWADPRDNLIYIFLSNRVYPDAGNKKLVQKGIRTLIQQVIYDAVAEGETNKQISSKSKY